MADESFETFLTKLLGTDAVQNYNELESQEPDFANLMKDFAIGKIWQRGGLSLKERSIATIASQVALGRWDQVETHMKSFLNLGGTRDELKEVLLHLCVYCGFPASLSALRILQKLSR
jgi:4-carboxymuconolactone decarboxylase